MSTPQRPLLRRAPMSGRVFVITRYTEGEDGIVVAHEKYDVTGEFDAMPCPWHHEDPAPMTPEREAIWLIDNDGDD